MNSRIAELENQVAELLIKHKYKLVEFVFIPKKNNPLIRIFIYRNEKGITHEDCNIVDKLLGNLFDEIFDNGYGLEVSSPGVGRKIKSYKDRIIFNGALVKITLKDQPAKKITGTLTDEQSEEKIAVNFDDKNFYFDQKEVIKLELA